MPAMSTGHVTTTESTFQLREMLTHDSSIKSDFSELNPNLSKGVCKQQQIQVPKSSQSFKPTGVDEKQSNGRYQNILPKPSPLVSNIGVQFDPLRMFELRLAQPPVSQPEVTEVSNPDSQEGCQTRVCNRCGKWFRSRQQLTQHMLVHSDVRKYRCTYCGRAFKQPSHLQQHHRIHTGEKPYKCNVAGCNRAFPQLSNLNHHLRNHDKPEPPKENTCSICDRTYVSETVLRNHVLKIHMMSGDISTDPESQNDEQAKQKTAQPTPAIHVTQQHRPSENQTNQYHVSLPMMHVPTTGYQLSVPMMPVSVTSSVQISTLPVPVVAPLKVPLYTNNTLVVTPAIPAYQPIQISSVLQQDIVAQTKEIAASEDTAYKSRQTSNTVLADRDNGYNHIVDESRNAYSKSAKFGRFDVTPVSYSDRAIFNTIPLEKIRQRSDAFSRSNKLLAVRDRQSPEVEAEANDHSHVADFDDIGQDTEAMNIYYSTQKQRMLYRGRSNSRDYMTGDELDDTSGRRSVPEIQPHGGIPCREQYRSDNIGPYNYTLGDIPDDGDDESYHGHNSDDGDYTNRHKWHRVQRASVRHLDEDMRRGEAYYFTERSLHRETSPRDEHDVIEIDHDVNDNTEEYLTDKHFVHINGGHKSRKRKAFQPQRVVTSLLCSD